MIIEMTSMLTAVGEQKNMFTNQKMFTKMFTESNCYSIGYVSVNKVNNFFLKLSCEKKKNRGIPFFSHIKD